MRLIIFIVSLIIISGCGLTDSTKDSGTEELNYPTTISKLGEEEYTNKNQEFKVLNNSQICTQLNEFGFCEYDLTPCINRPILREEITDEDEMIRMARECINLNSLYTGVVDINELVVESSSGIDGCIKCDGSNGDFKNIKWRIRFTNQIYNDYEVFNTGIFIFLDNEGVFMIGGNWYPRIAIPAHDEIDLTEAKESLLGKEISFMCWTPIEMTVASENIQEEARKIIIPVTFEDRVELRVAWEINIMFSDGLAFWSVYVDSTTGEIVLELPLIIC